MVAVNKIAILKERLKDGKVVKQPWNTMYQLVGEYVMTRKQNFLVNNMPGEFLTEQLFSSAGPEANSTMASSLLGQLWPNGARSFRIKRPRNIPDSKEVKKYYEDITGVLVDAMDHPEGNLAPSLMEYMEDQGAFGISGIGVTRTDDPFQPLKFKAHNVKNMVIDENEDGVVDTIFIEDEMSVRNLVSKYGEENVSAKVKEKFNKGQYTEKIKFVQVIEPRREGRGSFGNKGLPIASIHFEWDTNKILRESGFVQMPIIVSRFAKAMGEIYGRSPAMKALPAILRLNVLWEILMRGLEKNMNPPLYLLDNGALGSGVVDTSAGALNVFHTTGLGEKSPIGAIFDIKDIKSGFELANVFTNDITKAFLIDRLMDLNNETRMTLGEAQIRNRLRGEGLSSVFKRQETELFSRLIKSSFNNLLEMGLVGVIAGTGQERELLNQGIAPIYIPQVVAEAIRRGQKVYDIQYISPAHRIMRTEELQGLTMTVDMALGMAAGGIPSTLDVLDADRIIRDIADLALASEEILNDSETITKIRELQAQQAQQANQMAQAQVAADVNMKTSQAQSMREGALSGRPSG